MGRSKKDIKSSKKYPTSEHLMEGEEKKPTMKPLRVKEAIKLNVHLASFLRAISRKFLISLTSLGWKKEEE